MVIGVGVAVWQVVVAAEAKKEASRQAKSAAEANKEAAEANKLAEEALVRSYRPYVTLTLQSHPQRWRVSELVLQNYGKVPALDLQIEIEQMPATSDVGYDFRDARFVSDGLPILVPAQEIRTYFDHGIERTEQKVPKHCGHAIVRYRDPDGKRYEDRFPLDPAALEGTLRHEIDT